MTGLLCRYSESTKPPGVAMKTRRFVSQKKRDDREVGDERAAHLAVVWEKPAWPRLVVQKAPRSPTRKTIQTPIAELSRDSFAIAIQEKQQREILARPIASSVRRSVAKPKKCRSQQPIGQGSNTINT